MPASSANYLIAYKNHSQLYAAASKKVALESPPPEGFTIEEKIIWFITCAPDESAVRAYRLEDNEIRTAEIKEKKKKEKDNE